MNIVINGATGRMGKALLASIANCPGVFVTAGFDHRITLGLVDTHIQQCDVAVDFSVHTVTPLLCSPCVTHHKPLVIGTTGHTEEERLAITESSKIIPIVLSSNFSTGVNTLFWLTLKVAEILGPDFDLEVVEMHHRNKADAPSGTAKTLVNILTQVHQLQLDGPVSPRYGRQGIVGKRDPQEIGVHSIRGGDVVGEHTVIFAGNGERLELTHKVSSRETFANGALLAARWVLGKPPGLYDMQDVLGLRSL